MARSLVGPLGGAKVASTAVLFLICAASNAAEPADFEKASADQIVVTASVELARQFNDIIPMALSADETRIYYQVIDGKSRAPYLVIRSLESLQVTRRVRLPKEAWALAPSPDEAKLAYSFRDKDGGAKLAILDLKTQKAIPFVVSSVAPERLVWQSPDVLLAFDSRQPFARPGRNGGAGCYAIDLNTLQTHDLDAKLNYLWTPELLSKHKRAYLTLESQDFLTGGAVLVVTDRRSNFSRELSAFGRHDALLVARSLRFAIVGGHYGGSKYPSTLRLLRLGVHHGEPLGLEGRWEEGQSNALPEIQGYLTRGVAVYAEAYAPRQNPLNGRTIGREQFKSRVQIASINDHRLLAVTMHEKSPVAPGDVLCGFSSPRDQGGHGLNINCDRAWAVVTQLTPNVAMAGGNRPPVTFEEEYAAAIVGKPLPTSVPVELGSEVRLGGNLSISDDLRLMQGDQAVSPPLAKITAAKPTIRFWPASPSGRYEFVEIATEEADRTWLIDLEKKVVHEVYLAKYTNNPWISWSPDEQHAMFLGTEVLSTWLFAIDIRTLQRLEPNDGALERQGDTAVDLKSLQWDSPDRFSYEVALEVYPAYWKSVGRGRLRYRGAFDLAQASGMYKRLSWEKLEEPKPTPTRQ